MNEIETDVVTLKQFILDKIAELDASGKTAALNYFKGRSPDLTRQKLNALKKSGKFTFEFAESIFDNEEITIGPAEVTAYPDYPKTAAEARAAEDAFDPTSPPPSGLETPDGSTVTPVIPNADSMRPRRRPDVRLLDGSPRGAANGPQSLDHPAADANMIAGIISYLESQGWAPPAGSTVERQNLRDQPRIVTPPPQRVRIGAQRKGAPEQRPVAPRRQVRNWNDPPPPQR